EPRPARAAPPPRDAARTSSSVMRPAGPLPETVARSTASSRASRRVEGVAGDGPPAARRALPGGGDAAAGAAGARGCAGGGGGGGGAGPAAGRGRVGEGDEHRADLHRLARLDVHSFHPPR